MKIKVGDKLVVKKDLSEENDIEKYHYGINKEMVKFAGEEVTVKAITEEDDVVRIYIKEDGGEWTWTELMFDLIDDNTYLIIVDTSEEIYNIDYIKETKYEKEYDELRAINSGYLHKLEKIINNGEREIYVVRNLGNKKIHMIESSGVRKAVTKIGQKAKVNNNAFNFRGQTVTVVDVSNFSLEDNIRSIQIGVKFSRKSSQRHTCNGHCEDGYGWYYDINDLDFIEDSKKEVKKEKSESKNDKIESEEISKLTKEITKLTKEIKNRERFQDLMNEAVIEKGKEIAVEDLKEKLKSELDNFIEEKYGVLPKRIEVVTEKTHKELQGIFHKDFEKICKLVNANIPVMLTGGAGAGKNYTLEQVADALDLDFYFSNAVNQEYKLTGFVDANGTYHETEFYKAFTRGGMFFLDEIDASSPECLVILNSAIANKYFDFPTGRIKAHENFRVVCAGNTYGTGADMVYVGRNVLDGATLDRFVVIPFDYDENVEKQLAYDMELYDFIYRLRKAVNECQLRYVVSMRALINSSKMLELGMSKQEILKTAIIKNMQIDDLNTIYNKLPNSDWKDELDKYIKREEVA